MLSHANAGTHSYSCTHIHVSTWFSLSEWLCKYFLHLIWHSSLWTGCKLIITIACQWIYGRWASYNRLRWQEMGLAQCVGLAVLHDAVSQVQTFSEPPVEGILKTLGVTMVSECPQNSFGWEYKPGSSLCTHAFHRTDSWRPRQVNAGNKSTPSMHHARKWNVTTLMVGLKNSHICKNLTKTGEPQRYSWEYRKNKENLRYSWEHRIRRSPEIQLGTQNKEKPRDTAGNTKNKENPRDTAGNTE